MSSFYIKPSVRNAIVKRDRQTCCYCNEYVPKRERSLDHVTPQCRGGADNADNLILTCKACNSRKGSKSLKQFTQYLVIEGFMSQASAHNIHRRVYRRISKGI
jgi:5-methylcytosine-specific restriction endonuclease McrA